MPRASGFAYCLLAATLLGAGVARAQGAPSTPSADPVLATVNGQPIHLSDLKDAAEALPPNLRGVADPAALSDAAATS